VKEIKQQLASSPVQDAVASQSLGASSTLDTDEAYQSCIQPVFTEPEHHAKLVTRTIGDVELDPSCISALLEEYSFIHFTWPRLSLTTFKYYSHYYPQFPLIFESAHFLDKCDSCPLLFWAVITIAARECAEQKHLYPALTVAV
jgi:hypothetical protein